MIVVYLFMPNCTSVRSCLLGPCLEHLAERLPVMDLEVINSAKNEWRLTIQKIEKELKDLRDGLRNQAPDSIASPEILDNLVKELQQNIAVSLHQEVVQKLFNKARNPEEQEEEDTKLIKTINHINNEINEWIKGGFGIGKEEWIHKAEKNIIQYRSEDKFATEQLNNIRVEISEKYCEIDNELGIEVECLWSKISEIIHNNTGQLLEGIKHGQESLEKFAECLKNANEPCPKLQKAVEDILSLNISYRSHFHPQVRKNLDSLDYENVRHYWNQENNIDQKTKAAELFKIISDLAIQASYETRKALLSENLVSVLILHAAAEQFEDSLIRSEKSEREFKRFGRSYKDEIWPNKFRDIDAQNAKVTKVNRAIAELERILESDSQ